MLPALGVLTVVTCIAVITAFAFGIYLHTDKKPPEPPNSCHKVDVVWKGGVQDLKEELRQNIYRSVFVLNPVDPTENGIYRWDIKESWIRNEDVVLFEGQTLFESVTQQGWLITQIEPSLQAELLVECWFAPRPRASIPNGFASVSLGERRLKMESWNVSTSPTWSGIVSADKQNKE